MENDHTSKNKLYNCITVLDHRSVNLSEVSDVVDASELEQQVNLTVKLHLRGFHER